MAYNRTNWENSPSTNTPLSGDNLNNIEEGILDLESATNALAGTVGIFMGTAGTAVNTTATQGSITATQGSVANSQGSVVSINSTVSGLPSTVSSLQGSATTVQNSVDSLLGTANNMFGTVSNISGSVTDYGPRLGTIEANSWVTTSRIADGAVSLSKFAAAAGTPEISLLTTQTFTSSQSYVLPGSAKIIIVEVVGGGGGGAGAQTFVGYPSGDGRCYGGAGGAGGQMMRQTCTRAELSGTVTVTIGAGGSGGAISLGIGNAGGWSQFGPIYVPGGRPGNSATGANQREFGLTFGSGGYGGNGGYSDTVNGGGGYRNFRGAGGGGGGCGLTHGYDATGEGIISSAGVGGKGFDVPANVWPTTNTNSVTVSTGGRTGAAGDGGNGATSGWVNTPNGFSRYGVTGGAGVTPGGGGGGGAPSAFSAQYYGGYPAGAGGAGARGEVKIWVFG